MQIYSECHKFCVIALKILLKYAKYIVYINYYDWRQVNAHICNLALNL